MRRLPHCGLERLSVPQCSSPELVADGSYG